MCMQAVTPSSVPVTLGMLARARPTGKRTESIQDNGYLPLWHALGQAEVKVERTKWKTRDLWRSSVQRLDDLERHKHERAQVDDVVFVCVCMYFFVFCIFLLHSSLRMRAAHIKNGGGRRGTPLDGSHKSFVLVKSKREIFVRVQSRCGSKQQAMSEVMFQIPCYTDLWETACQDNPNMRVTVLLVLTQNF